MHSIRKIVVSAVVVVLLIVGFEAAYQYLYQEADQIIIYTANDMEETKGSIDTLFIGTSLVHNGLNPEVYDEATGENSLNLGTSAQPISGAYYLLKDQIKVNPVKRVILGMSPTYLLSDEETTAAQVGVYDRLMTFSTKMEYLAKVVDIKNIPNVVLFSARDVNANINIFDLQTVKENLEYKASEAYKNNIPPEGSAYVTKGYVASDKKFNGKKKKAGFDNKWKDERVQKESEEYFQKILDLCKEKNIELVLITTPVPQVFYKQMGDVKGMHDYLQKAADENGAKFYDFGYYKNVVEEFPNKMFKDKHHLNREGAAKLTKLLAEILQKEESGEDVSSYFSVK